MGRSFAVNFAFVVGTGGGIGFAVFNLRIGAVTVIYFEKPTSGKTVVLYIMCAVFAKCVLHNITSKTFYNKKGYFIAF